MLPDMCSHIYNYTVKRDRRTFRMGERTGFTGLERVTAVESQEIAKITAYDFGRKKNSWLAEKQE